MRTLSEQELRFFHREGYVVLPSLMDPTLCARVRDRLWECNGSSRLRRDDPQTWLGPFSPDDTSNETADVRSDYRWKACWGIAEQLLGKGGAIYPAGGDPFGVFEGKNVRGVYCTLPQGPEAARVPLRDQPGAHWDSGVTDDSMTPARFMVTGLIDDTPPGVGGFTLYPRSHRRLFELAVRTRAEGIAPASEEAFKRRRSALVAEIVADTEPVECSGPVGTVVLWHRCTMHKVADNHSSLIRQAILYDFVTSQPLGDGCAPPFHFEEEGERLKVVWAGRGPRMWECWAPVMQAIEDEMPRASRL